MVDGINNVCEYKVIKPPSSELSSSEYYVCFKYGVRDHPPRQLDVTDVFNRIINPIDNREDHAKIHRDIHAVTYNGEHIARFSRSLNPDELPIHRPILEYIKQLNFKDINNVVNLHIITGCSGAGKTVGLDLRANDVYVAPLKKLMDNKNFKHRLHMTHDKFLCSLIEGNKYDHVYIDEYCLLPKGYYGLVDMLDGCDEITLLGDPYQISLVDFNGVYTHNDDMKYLKRTWDNNKTKRFGKNTCKLIKSHLNLSIESDKDDVVKFLKFDNLNKHEVENFKDSHWLTFTQDMKSRLISLGGAANTIHEAMGSTFPNVMLYVNGKDLMNGFIHNVEYTYVGMTRHQLSLTVVCDGDDDKAVRYLNTLDTMIDVNLSRSDAAPFSDTYLTPDDEVVEKSIHEISDAPSFDVKTSIQGVEHILTELGLNNGQIEILEQYDATLPTVPRYNFAGDPVKAKIKISSERMHPKRICIKGKRLSMHGYAKYYCIKDSFKTTQTFIARYMQTAQRKPKMFKAILSAIKVLQKGFIKMTRFNTLKEYYQFCDPTIEDISRHAADYVQSLKEKSGGINEKMMKDINRQLTEMKVEIDFFMKNQPKHVTSFSKYLIFKAGQGVSSWPKCMNLIFCAYTRHLNEKLPDCMSDGTTKKFVSQFACNRPDHELSKTIAQFGPQIASGELKPMGTDFTEHDTSHSLIVKLWECADFIGCGFPIALVQDYFNIYANWTQTNISPEGKVSVYNHWIQHSGSSNTLHGNTKVTIGANGCCFDFKGLRYIGFKGDDTESLSRSYKFTTFSKVAGSKLNRESSTLLKELFGFKLKIDDNKVGEFICNFITPYGFFPDIIRRVTRMVSKIHNDDVSWNEARRNMNECMSVIKNDVAYNAGLIYANQYYNNIGLKTTTEQLDYLCQFAANVSKSDFVYPEQEYVIDVMDASL
jgi:hypothetical protein